MGETKETKLKREQHCLECLFDEALECLISNTSAIHSLGHTLSIMKTDLDVLNELMDELELYDEAIELHHMSATLEAALEICKLSYKKSNTFLADFQEDDENEEE